MESSKRCRNCHSTHVVKYGKDRGGNQRFLCKQCKKTFTQLSNNHPPAYRHELRIALLCLLEGVQFRDIAHMLNKNVSEIEAAKQLLPYWRQMKEWGVIPNRRVVTTYRIDPDAFSASVTVKKKTIIVSAEQNNQSGL